MIYLPLTLRSYTHERRENDALGVERIYCFRTHCKQFYLVLLLLLFFFFFYLFCLLEQIRVIIGELNFSKERDYTTVQKKKDKIQRINSNVLLIIMKHVKVRSKVVTELCCAHSGFFFFFKEQSH